MIDQKKLEDICRELKKKEYDALFIGGPAPDSVYLAGLELFPDERTKGLMIGADGRCFALTPKMYEPEFARVLGPDVPLEVWTDCEGFGEAFKRGCERLGLARKKIAFNDGVLAIDLIKMKSCMDFSFADGASITSPLRSIKSADEIINIEKASEIVDRVMDALTGFIKPGITEKTIKKKILDLFDENEAEGVSFDPIVGTGPNGAIAHYTGGEGIVKRGDFVKVDIGCRYRGYCSDAARTFCVGEPAAEQLAVYEVVKAAQKAGEAAIKKGATGQDLDRAARKVIRDAGYGNFTGSRLGHGIGLAVHEEPYIVEGNNAKLMPGNVFSVEPGIALSGKFGIQIENLVIVEPDGTGRALNKFTRDLLIIG